MNIFIPQPLLQLAEALPQPLYLVGGYVRNAVLGLQATDIDLAANMSVDDILSRLPCDAYRISTINQKLGTLQLLHIKSNQKYEYTAFRTETYQQGGNHQPIAVAFTDDIKQDALRRDCKANAVYYHILNATVLDPLHGLTDINNRILSAVCDPIQVFSSDGLRILRIIRQAAELNFEIEVKTFAACTQMADLLKDISAERIRQELQLMLCADQRYPSITQPTFAHMRALQLLQECRALQQILPEVAAGAGVSQRKDFHRYPVLEHTFFTVGYATVRTRLAALFHDVAKPACSLENGNFFGHDRRGAEMTLQIMNRLKFPKKTIALTVRLVRLHMQDLRGDMKEGKLRKLLVDNQDIMPQLLELKQADYLASGLTSGISPVVAKWSALYHAMQSDGTPFMKTALKINANDLLNLGCPPIKISQVLQTMHELCILQPQCNTHDRLVDYYLSHGVEERSN